MKFLLDLNSKFNHIIFRDENHSYINTNTGKLYTSGTSFIKKFEVPYDSEYFANKKSEKLKKSKQEILDLWAMKGLVGRTRGSIIHKFNEDLWQNKEFPISNPDWVLKLPTRAAIDYIKSIDILKQHSLNYWNDFKNIYVPIRLEPVVGDDEWNIATMIDKIVYDTQTNMYGIIDYKTDAQIGYYSKYKKKYLDPISHLDDCEINKYSIQTEISKRIIEKHCDVKIEFRKIVWLNRNNDSYVKIDCVDVNKEVDLMLDCYG